MAERDLDVVVFGATGVTGRNVALYLAERAGETGARWAPAARDAAKVERLLGEAGVTAPDTIAADVGDRESLAAMASRTRVVLDLVGPYSRYGRPVIEACVDAGAHYVDLSGEMPFVRHVIEAFDANARAAGVKVVQTCGFEALPADLAVLLAADTARERWDERLAEVDLEFILKSSPGLPRPSDISGGTLQSLAEITGAEDATTAADPAALVIDEALADEVRRRSPIQLAPRRGSRGAVVAPMLPGPFINPPVIHRSAELAGNGGAPFRYREGVALPGKGAALPLSLGIAATTSGVQAGLRAVTRAPLGARRRIGGALGSILPGAGFGPASDRLEGWRWTMSVEARTGGGRFVQVEVEGEGHPGYLATARMMGEAGLLLAEAGATPERAGCLTPATALGAGSAERFERARLRFSVTA